MRSACPLQPCWAVPIFSCCLHPFAGNATQLAFVGHSQGTTQAFAALASQPELRRQLSFAAMLAPAVHMRHIRSYPLQVLASMDADRVRASVLSWQLQQWGGPATCNTWLR